MHSFLRTRTVLLATVCAFGLATVTPPAVEAATVAAAAKPKPGVRSGRSGCSPGPSAPSRSTGSTAA